MVKTDALSFRVASEVKAALERVAMADDRSVSGLVERILRQWLVDNGHLEPSQKGEASGVNRD
jgi:predicted transcriptional regulator